MKSKSLLVFFILSIFSAILVVTSMALMSADFAVQELAIFSWILFFVIGGILVFLTFRQKVKGKIKKLLLLTGFSAAGFFVFVFAHNMFYALAEICEEISILHGIFQILEVIGFLVAIFACPIGFVVGVIGTIVYLLKNRKKK